MGYQAHSFLALVGYSTRMVAGSCLAPLASIAWLAFDGMAMGPRSILHHALQVSAVGVQYVVVARAVEQVDGGVARAGRQKVVPVDVRPQGEASPAAPIAPALRSR